MLLWSVYDGWSVVCWERSLSNVNASTQKDFKNLCTSNVHTRFHSRFVCTSPVQYVCSEYIFHFPLTTRKEVTIWLYIKLFFLRWHYYWIHRGLVSLVLPVKYFVGSIRNDATTSEQGQGHKDLAALLFVGMHACVVCALLSLVSATLPQADNHKLTKELPLRLFPRDDGDIDCSAGPTSPHFPWPVVFHLRRP